MIFTDSFIIKFQFLIRKFLNKIALITKNFDNPFSIIRLIITHSNILYIYAFIPIYRFNKTIINKCK